MADPAVQNDPDEHFWGAETPLTQKEPLGHLMGTAV